MPTTTRRGALPRLFHKLVLGVALAASPAAFADTDATDDDDGPLTEVDRAIGTVLDTMVDRALTQHRDVVEVLGILLHHMHPLDATSSVCETALSPHPEVRRLLVHALERDLRIVGSRSALGHLAHDGDLEVRLAAVRALRGTR